MEKFIFVESDEIIDRDTSNGVVRLDDGRQVRASRVRVLTEIDAPVYWYESETLAAVKSYVAAARAEGGRSGADWADAWNNRPA